jgi:fermentation-respiration switch protein FrsA (DUF1100 family)
MALKLQMSASPVYLIAAFLILLFVALVWIPAIEKKSTYYPTREFDSEPGSVGLVFEEVTFQAEDGVPLVGWWMPASGAARGTMIFFHGNAGNMSHRLIQAQILHALGLNLLYFDYRGYGKSGGTPSEKGLYADARAALKYAQGRQPGPLLYYGESLGAAAAIDLAVESPPAALVLEAPFISVPEMAKKYYPWVPAWLLHTRYDNLSKIGKIAVPTLFFHSTDDAITPYEHSRRLSGASGSKSRLVPLTGGHNGAFMMEMDRIAKELDRFLREAGL